MSEQVKILFVDDEPINLLVFETCFGEHHSVLTANSGQEALDMLESEPNIGIVFTDMRMPGMNGIELARRAKAIYPSKMFFVLTGYGLTEAIKAAIDEGIVNACLYKPFDLDEVESEIANAKIELSRV